MRTDTKRMFNYWYYNIIFCYHMRWLIYIKLIILYKWNKNNMDIIE